jgi:hypothetical protein
MPWRRILVIVVGLLVVLPIAGISIFIATFNPNGWKPRIQNAVMRATGRELSLNGPVSLKWSLMPTIEARDVALANFDGGSRPQWAAVLCRHCLDFAGARRHMERAVAGTRSWAGRRPAHGVPARRR